LPAAGNLTGEPPVAINAQIADFEEQLGRLRGSLPSEQPRQRRESVLCRSAPCRLDWLTGVSVGRVADQIERLAPVIEGLVLGAHAP
jgi:hypothetical protein